MKDENERLEKAMAAGLLKKFWIYSKMSGPGWLQAAVTLGGGSLAGSLYLGVIGGYSLLWLQPLAMICGVIMLGALAYMTLSMKQSPYEAVCKHITPVLAWAWLVATVVVDCIFCPAQSALGQGIVEQNFGLDPGSPFLVTVPMALCCLAVVFFYALGSKGVSIFENILKIMVGIVILCFFGAATVHFFSGSVQLTHVLKGYIPDFTALFSPAASLEQSIDDTGPYAGQWRELISSTQRNIIIGSFGAVVGVNMALLLPYTIKKKGWGRRHRELSRYDLFCGLALPFMLAVSLLVVTGAAQFHNQSTDILDENGKPKALAGEYYSMLEKRARFEVVQLPAGEEEKRALLDQLPIADRKLAASLTKRDAGQLAMAITPLVGSRPAQLIFGVGIFAMALSTMIVHMLINGFAISQAVGKPGKLIPFMIGAATPALTAALSPVLWSGASKAAMQIPAGITATVLLPIAYLIFFLLMNSKKSLGEDMPRGGKRIMVNVAMLFSLFVAGFAATWALHGRGDVFGTVGIVLLVAMAVTGLLSFLWKEKHG